MNSRDYWLFEPISICPILNLQGCMFIFSKNYYLESLFPFFGENQLHILQLHIYEPLTRCHHLQNLWVVPLRSSCSWRALPATKCWMKHGITKVNGAWCGWLTKLCGYSPKQLVQDLCSTGNGISWIVWHEDGIGTSKILLDHDEIGFWGLRNLFKIRLRASTSPFAQARNKTQNWISEGTWSFMISDSSGKPDWL